MGVGYGYNWVIIPVMSIIAEPSKNTLTTCSQLAATCVHSRHSHGMLAFARALEDRIRELLFGNPGGAGCSRELGRERKKFRVTSKMLVSLH